MTGTLRYDRTVGDTGTTHMSKGNDLIQLFEDLKKQAKNILADDWLGAAAEAFDTAQQRWNAEAQPLGDAHVRAGHAATQAAQNAFDTDNRVRGLFHV
ncbi:hypothetical protein FNH05_06405 [Amycolatopsis rhizosphaerae]|uniref:WXG100 family type VII secretion target n=1 Tax=Amycolatopsis rhizosphaerae TaxID=2053003 RepID=A0A558DC96_9PSEU|nr:WXG100 family type VII secretion target [Amycolatopsis rhizosphaerae]TVT58652.1 hypothetical protein FNH05_06405 [Amycolatopsis rhizosphaerae]